MIIPEPDADTASTTRTLTPNEPPIPAHFLALITLSAALSFTALVTTLLAFGRSDPAHAAPALLAFALGFVYHTAAYLFAWLHAHGVAGILPLVAPGAPGGVAGAAGVAALWGVAAGLSVRRVVLALSPARDHCVNGVFNGVNFEPCRVFYPRGPAQVPLFVAAATTIVEMLVSGVIVIVCEMHRRRSASLDGEEGASSTLESEKNGSS